MQTGSRNGAYQLAGTGGSKIGDELRKILRKRISDGLIPPERTGGHWISTRRTPEPEIDATWKERLECPELLGNHEGRVVGQHDSTGANANGGCAGRHVSNHDAGCRTGNT